MKNVIKTLPLLSTIALLTACGGGGGGDPSPSPGGGTTNPGTGNSAFEYPDEFDFIGDATVTALLFKTKANAPYFYLRDYSAAFGMRAPFFSMDAFRTAATDSSIKEISCETGSATFNGDEIYANMWNFTVFDLDCKTPITGAFNGKITVNEIAQSGPNAGNINGVIGSIADSAPFYQLTSDGLSSDSTKGYLGDYALVYDNGPTGAYSINIESLRISNYLADTQPDYEPNSSSDITRTIKDYSEKTGEDTVFESLRFNRTWIENGREFTIKFDGQNFDLDEMLGSYTFTLDETGSNLHDVTFTANFHGTYMILTHTVNGATTSTNVEFY